MSFDWNNAAEQTLAAALGLVPTAGPILAGFVYIFWPQDQPDVWQQIQAQVESLIHQQLSTYEQEQVTNNLAGLQNALSDYLAALVTGDIQAISDQWIVTSTLFDSSLPNFQSPNYQVLLLPMFAQFATMNLALLRDGVIAGDKWGWNDDYQKLVATKLSQKIIDYCDYVTAVNPKGSADAWNTTADPHACQPFRNGNAYQRHMNLTVIDFLRFWYYMDVTKFPDPVTVLVQREIYSDPVGTCDDSGRIFLPDPPSAPISQITVWAGDRIDAIQLAYPQGGGPNGVTVTARMGDTDGGSNQPPHGGVLNIEGRPVTLVAGNSGDILNALTLRWEDGTEVQYGDFQNGQPFAFSYEGEVLSSIHINGTSDFYGSADCAVFGFQFPGGIVPKTKTAQKILTVTRLPGTPPPFSLEIPEDLSTEHLTFWRALNPGSSGFIADR